MPAASPAKAIRVFYSYAHADEKLCVELQKHLAVLRRQDVIAEWHDRKIGAGTKWKDEIDIHLNEADIILLLISPNFYLPTIATMSK